MIQVITASLKQAGKKVLTREFLKFVIVGVISAALEFSLLITTVEYFGMGYLAGNLIAFLSTNMVTYSLSRRYVFGASGNKKVYEAALFGICLLGGLALNQVVLWTFVEFTWLDYRIAKIVAILVTIVWNFLSRKHLVFRNKKTDQENEF